MTTQMLETLIDQGKTLKMLNEPLEKHLARDGHYPDLDCTCSALWRGYRGTWQIIDNRLYLIQIEGTLRNGEPADIGSFFPQQAQPVWAQWCSETLHILLDSDRDTALDMRCNDFGKVLCVKVRKGQVRNRYVHDHFMPRGD